MFPILQFQTYRISLGFDRGAYWAIACDDRHSIEGIFDSDPHRALERAKLEVLKSIADRSEKPTLLVRPDGIIIHANLEARKLFGIAPGKQITLPDSTAIRARWGAREYWIVRTVHEAGGEKLSYLELLDADSALECLDIAFESR